MFMNEVGQRAEVLWNSKEAITHGTLQKWVIRDPACARKTKRFSHTNFFREIGIGEGDVLLGVLWGQPISSYTESQSGWDCKGP